MKQAMLLRVLTYNLYFGGTDRVDAIHAVLANVDADVIAFTEADDRGAVETLAERLNMRHVWARGSGDRHIATLSRFPITEWRIYNKPPLTQAVLETKLVIAPPSPDGNSRQGRGVGGVGSITVYNVHLLPYLLLPFEIRRWQAVGKLLEVIRTQQPGPHLIMGDLNAIAPGDRVRQHKNPARMRGVMMLQFRLIFRLAIPRLLKAGYMDCFRAVHPNDDGFTWMPGNPTTRYDYIMVDSTLASSLRACRVVEEDEIEAVTTASDHFPLLAEFEL